MVINNSKDSDSLSLIRRPPILFISPIINLIILIILVFICEKLNFSSDSGWTMVYFSYFSIAFIIIMLNVRQIIGWEKYLKYGLYKARKCNNVPSSIDELVWMAKVISIGTCMMAVFVAFMTIYSSFHPEAFVRRAGIGSDQGSRSVQRQSEISTSFWPRLKCCNRA